MFRLDFRLFHCSSYIPNASIKVDFSTEIVLFAATSELFARELVQPPLKCRLPELKKRTHSLTQLTAASILWVSWACLSNAAENKLFFVLGEKVAARDRGRSKFLHAFPWYRSRLCLRLSQRKRSKSRRSVTPLLRDAAAWTALANHALCFFVRRDLCEIKFNNYPAAALNKLLSLQPTKGL